MEQTITLLCLGIVSWAFIAWLHLTAQGHRVKLFMLRGPKEPTNTYFHRVVRREQMKDLPDRRIQARRGYVW